MKKIYLILIIIIAIAAIVRFAFLPSLIATVSGSCIAHPQLNSLLNSVVLIVVGTASEENVVNTDEATYTDTSMGDLIIMRGTFTGSILKARQFGGCNLITGICVEVSETAHFQQGSKYLLFLRQYPEYDNDVYGGFSACGGVYELSPDPALQNTQIETTRDAIDNMDEEKWQEFIAML